jgi:hypothetical protein
MGEPGWVYLIRDGKERRRLEPIIKVGMTNNFNRRIIEYAYLSDIICVMYVSDKESAEKALLARFNELFKLHGGHEWFLVPNLYEAINAFYEEVSNYMPNPDDFDAQTWNDEDKRRMNVEKQQHRKRELWNQGKIIVGGRSLNGAP